jgi:hypothetical protein
MPETMAARGTECWCRFGYFECLACLFVLLVMTPDSKELGCGLPSSKKKLKCYALTPYAPCL